MGKSDGVQRATGRTREEWFTLLDSWGAAGRGFREISGWLVDEQALSKWWAQKLIVEYEESRGLRSPGARPNGTFEVSASKTVHAPVGLLFDLVVDGRRRRRWLPDARMSLRSCRPGRSARFDWEDGPTRVNVGFIAKGPTKSTIAVAHENLPDARTAETTKAMWRERLAELGALLEP